MQGRCLKGEMALNEFLCQNPPHLKENPLVNSKVRPRTNKDSHKTSVSTSQPALAKSVLRGNLLVHRTTRVHVLILK